MNKKTFLFLKSLELGTAADVLKLKKAYTKSSESPDKKIQRTLEIFKKTGAAKATSQAIHTYTKAAFDVLESFDIDPIKKQQLRDFGAQLMTRTS